MCGIRVPPGVVEAVEAVEAARGEVGAVGKSMSVTAAADVLPARRARSLRFSQTEINICI